MIADVQDILHGNGTDSSSTVVDPVTNVTPLDAILGADQQKKKRQQQQLQLKKSAEVTFKRPEGMHRELYALLADGKKTDVAPLVPTFTSSSKQGGYMSQKARLGLRKVRKWKMKYFINQARKDDLKLYHWRRNDMDLGEEYPFARFNKVIDVPSFSDEEYEKYLTKTDWTREETDHLMELCGRFDLRWYVIHDRYDNDKFGNKKTVEDLKERYYDIVNILMKARSTDGEPNLLHFDADHERRRKEQLEKLWNRTKEQVEEEEFLTQEQKKIEGRRRERERKAQDLQKLISLADRAPSASPVTPGAAGIPSSIQALKKKTPKLGRIPSNAGPSTGVSLSGPDFTGIRFPEMKSAGPHLRSQGMKLPNIGQKKVKCIEQALEKLPIELHPPASEQVVHDFNSLRSDIALLYELKTALASAEYELEALRHRYQAVTGKVFDIPTKLRVTSTADHSSGPMGPTSKRRITDVMDLQIGTLPTRKRKAAIEQSNILKKLRRS